MFLDHEQRPVPPRWEPPGRKSAGRRGENAAITLILLISLLGFLTPVAGGTIVAMLIAIFGR